MKMKMEQRYFVSRFSLRELGYCLRDATRHAAAAAAAESIQRVCILSGARLQCVTSRQSPEVIYSSSFWLINGMVGSHSNALC
jgi:hypothetical protein